MWFNESPSGIFLGYYGSGIEHHHSIHADGERHLRSVDGKDLSPKAKGPPIADVTGSPQLLSASFPLPPPDHRSLAYSVGEKADVIGVVDVPPGREGDRVSLSYHLIHRESEGEFLRDRIQWPGFSSMPPHELALCLTVALDNFPSHKVGFTIHRPIK